MNNHKLVELIYEKAKAQGIQIECNPNHKKPYDHVGAGVRFVTFPNSNKIHKYRDTLTNIALRLNLITDNDILEHDDTLTLCPKCGKLQQKRIVEKYGYCMNC